MRKIQKINIYIIWIASALISVYAFCANKSPEIILKAICTMTATENASKKSRDSKDTIIEQSSMVKEFVSGLCVLVDDGSNEIEEMANKSGMIVEKVERFADMQEETSQRLELLKQATIESNENVSNNLNLAESMKVEYQNVTKYIREVMEEQRNFQQSMSEISNTMQESVDSAAIFLKESEKIKIILEEMNEISLQTNLLSFKCID